jgi:YfiR/HmsC-like
VRQNVRASVNRSLFRRCRHLLLALGCLITVQGHAAPAAGPGTPSGSLPASASQTPAGAPAEPAAVPSGDAHTILSSSSVMLEASASPSTNAATSAAVAQVVFGIISYTRWPADPAELHLCVVPPSNYTGALIQGAAHAPGRPVQVQRVAPDDPALGTTCDVVYIGAVNDDERARVFARLPGRAALTISEHDDECAVGSVFCLAIHDAQVSFKVNLDSLARSGVRVHPSVLQLAHGKASRQ